MLEVPSAHEEILQQGVLRFHLHQYLSYGLETQRLYGILRAKQTDERSELLVKGGQLFLKRLEDMLGHRV